MSALAVIGAGIAAAWAVVGVVLGAPVTGTGSRRSR
jgi:hypothetical protein